MTRDYITGSVQIINKDQKLEHPKPHSTRKKNKNKNKKVTHRAHWILCEYQGSNCGREEKMQNTLDVLENGKMHHNILDPGLLECRSQHAYVKFQAGMAANLRN
jgi:hypothetical protein